MNIPLKYLLPLLALITGLILIVFETFIQVNMEKEKMLQHSFREAKVIGNRLASRINLESKNAPQYQQRLLSVTAPYLADNLDQVEVYSQDLEEIFSSNVISSSTKKEKFSHLTALKVLKNKYSDLHYIEESQHITGYFPLDLKTGLSAKDDTLRGIVYMVFNITNVYKEFHNSIINNLIMNIIFMGAMMFAFSLFIYIFVFKRLNLLHTATKKMNMGDFDVKVRSGGKDELGEVMDSFNLIAKEMNSYKNSMESKINQAIQERTEQSKIMIQQSRLASMGEMIGNIAHQWRQPLNALGLVVQKIELFSLRNKLTPEIIHENVEKSTKLISKMSTTIDDFRDFFKPDKQKEYFPLAGVIEKVMDLLEVTFRAENIDIELDVSPFCEIYGFKNEFSQVIVNILNNSKDALIDKDIKAGRVKITVKDKNEAVYISISDNAGGIPGNIIDRIFEPYYTTKEEGKGTGIGLYMSKMIVEENMKGIISVRNGREGAEFSMVFLNNKRMRV